MIYDDDKNPKTPQEKPRNPKGPQYPDDTSKGRQQRPQLEQRNPQPIPLVNQQPAQQQQASTMTAKFAGKWKQQVGAAKVNWGKLTEDELLKTEGRSQQLAGLVQERYALSREIAEEQVMKFMEKNNH